MIVMSEIRALVTEKNIPYYVMPGTDDECFLLAEHDTEATNLEVVDTRPFETYHPAADGKFRPTLKETLRQARAHGKLPEDAVALEVLDYRKDEEKGGFFAHILFFRRDQTLLHHEFLFFTACYTDPRRQ